MCSVLVNKFLMALILNKLRITKHSNLDFVSTNLSSHISYFSYKFYRNPVQLLKLEKILLYKYFLYVGTNAAIFPIF